MTPVPNFPIDNSTVSNVIFCVTGVCDRYSVARNTLGTTANVRMYSATSLEQ